MAQDEGKLFRKKMPVTEFLNLLQDLEAGDLTVYHQDIPNLARSEIPDSRRNSTR